MRKILFAEMINSQVLDNQSIRLQCFQHGKSFNGLGYLVFFQKAVGCQIKPDTFGMGICNHGPYLCRSKIL